MFNKFFKDLIYVYEEVKADPALRNFSISFFSVLFLGFIFWYFDLLPALFIFIFTGTEEELSGINSEITILSVCETLLIILLNVAFIIILSSWVRAAGPRARVDFLSDITWKKLLIFVVLMLNFALVLY